MLSHPAPASSIRCLLRQADTAEQKGCAGDNCGPLCLVAISFTLIHVKIPPKLSFCLVLSRRQAQQHHVERRRQQSLWGWF